jgi:putative component of membrane protein insertase Oxa1/YidC/SpoIIIJ protein YidD
MAGSRSSTDDGGEPDLGPGAAPDLNQPDLDETHDAEDTDADEEDDEEEPGKKATVADASDGCALTACDLVPDGCSGGDGCSGCDPGCNLMLVGSGLPRLSTLMLAAAAVAPRSGADTLVRAAIALYRRFLTRFIPACPATPSCSAYALAEIDRLGARGGLRAAAARIRSCGPGVTAAVISLDGVARPG